MTRVKQLASFILLMIYSVGIVHGAIPHSHFDGKDDVLVLEHGVPHHHHHDTNYIGSHTHVVHGGHLDNGLMDLLICLLSESEYEDIADLFIGGASVNEVSLDLAKLQLAAVLVPFLTFDVGEVETIAAQGWPEADILYCYTQSDSSSRRGPPTVS